MINRCQNTPYSAALSIWGCVDCSYCPCWPMSKQLSSTLTMGFPAIWFWTTHVKSWAGRVKHSLRYGPSLLHQSFRCNRSPVYLLFCSRHGCMALSECYAKECHLAAAVPYLHSLHLLQRGGKHIFCLEDPLCLSGQALDRGWPPTCQLLGAALQIDVSGFLQPHAWATGTPGCTHCSVWSVDVSDPTVLRVLVHSSNTLNNLRWQIR